MSLIWMPEPILPLILSQEHETNISAIVIVAGEEGQPSPNMLVWSMPDGMPDNMRVHSAANTLKIDIENWINFFKIEINYMQDGDPVQVPGQVERWEDLPAAQSDVHAFIPDPRNVRNLRLIVEAYRGNQLMETTVYTITVYANYNLGRDALKTALQQRKDVI